MQLQTSSSLCENNTFVSLPQDIRRHKTCHSGVLCFMTNEKIEQHLKHKVFGERSILLKPGIIFTLKLQHVYIEIYFSYCSYDVFSLENCRLALIQELKLSVSLYIQ